MPNGMDGAEHRRLVEYRLRKSNWKKWGPYLSERAWGTVREDYSAGGDPWRFFPHEHARSKAYRWNEDGLGGISDRFQYICFTPAFWNGRDPILKERYFGLSGPQGNHGEDVKECYFYLDGTPTHSYMKMLYKYPQAEFPYAKLASENARRSPHDSEYELLDTGVFAEDRYFDVFIEYAKADEEDILIRITAVNRGPEPAECHILPTLWFRNTWSWGYEAGPMGDVPGKPILRLIRAGGAGEAPTPRDNFPEARGPRNEGEAEGAEAAGRPGDKEEEDRWEIEASHPAAGVYHFYSDGSPEYLFTENETNVELLYGVPNAGPYVKDAFHRYVVNGEASAVNPASEGAKAAAWRHEVVPPGDSMVVRLRLSRVEKNTPFRDFDEVFRLRMEEADEFYRSIQNPNLSEDERNVQRQALAGMLWSKQFYYYDIEQWLEGDPAPPPPPESRKDGRNHDWEHLNNFDVISMPDKWEYPWYASWDLAFHCLPIALVDADFAKRQLNLLAREWYMHPNGQLPAYEWNLGDCNPPVHAWATWRVYQIDAKQRGKPDRAFLEGAFHKLLLNFTWWVNKEDAEGRNVFQGGFLGLDNISVFNRSDPLPTGGHIDQSDGTSWMAFFCLVMLKMALELAREDPVYQDTASKFFEHFLRIARAMTSEYRGGVSLWDEEDGFFYDALHLPDGRIIPLKVRSLVGLMPLLAVETLDPELVEGMPVFQRRMDWFFRNRVYLRDQGNVACVRSPGERSRRLLSISNRDRLVRVLGRMLDEDEFLSPYGIRSLSKRHMENPYVFNVNGEAFTIRYEPAESTSGLFGGNSNWRGPVWFPLNYLIIESLQKYHHYFGESLKVECPAGSGRMMTLDEVAAFISRRLISLFLRDGSSGRPIFGETKIFREDPHWRDLLLFHEYFHGEDGRGLGSSHQTGWTGLAAKLIQQSGGAEETGGD